MNTIENSRRNIANNPWLKDAADTREGYECVCDLMTDWGWKEVKRSRFGRTFQDKGGERKFLPYFWFKKKEWADKLKRINNLSLKAQYGLTLAVAAGTTIATAISLETISNTDIVNGVGISGVLGTGYLGCRMLEEGVKSHYRLRRVFWHDNS